MTALTTKHLALTQSKYLDAQKTQNLEIGTLQRELDEVVSPAKSRQGSTTAATDRACDASPLAEQKAEKERYRVSLRDTEMGVDDLERSERSVSVGSGHLSAVYLARASADLCQTSGARPQHEGERARR